MSVTDPEMFFEAVIREAARELTVRRCSLALEQHGELRIVAGVGLPKQTIGMQVARQGSIAGYVFSTGKQLTEKTVSKELANSPRAGQYATNSFISHPVKFDQRCVGVLSVSDRLDGSDFDRADEKAVSEVARKLALVLARATGVG